MRSPSSDNRIWDFTAASSFTRPSIQIAAIPVLGTGWFGRHRPKEFRGDIPFKVNAVESKEPYIGTYPQKSICGLRQSL
jgi:hypothetical protein